MVRKVSKKGSVSITTAPSETGSPSVKKIRLRKYVGFAFVTDREDPPGRLLLGGRAS